jgi:hypothetical protein
VNSLGVRGAGMCFLSEKNFNFKSFPNENLTNFEPLTQKYYLAHSKVFL